MDTTQERQDVASVPPDARPPRWHRLWTLAYSRLAARRPNGVPALSVPSAVDTGTGRRMRIIGLACLAVVLVVVLAGATVGSVIGAAGLKVMRSLTATEPLVSGQTTPTQPR